MRNRRRTVLLIDNDSNELTVAARALRKAGIDGFEAAQDGESALRILGIDTEPGSALNPLPKVILIDLKMPRMDGFQVLEEIRRNEWTRAVPVVVVSSSRRPEDIAKAYAMGANSFVVKRFDGNRPGGHIADVAHYWLSLNEAPPREAEKRTEKE